jgi:hypothetical protein
MGLNDRILVGFKYCSENGISLSPIRAALEIV